MIRNNRRDRLTRGPTRFGAFQRCVADASHRPQPGDSANFERGTQALRYAWTSEAPNIAKRRRRPFPVDLVTMPTGPAGAFHVAGGCPVTVSATTRPSGGSLQVRRLLWTATSEAIRNPGIHECHKKGIQILPSRIFKSPDVPIEALMGPTAVEPDAPAQL